MLTYLCVRKVRFFSLLHVDHCCGHLVKYRCFRVFICDNMSFTYAYLCLYIHIDICTYIHIYTYVCCKKTVLLLLQFAPYLGHIVSFWRIRVPSLSFLVNAVYNRAQLRVGRMTVAHGQHPSSILESRKILFDLEPGWQFLKCKAQRRLVALRCVSVLLQPACFRTWNASALGNTRDVVFSTTLCLGKNSLLWRKVCIANAYRLRMGSARNGSVWQRCATSNVRVGATCVQISYKSSSCSSSPSTSSSVWSSFSISLSSSSAHVAHKIAGHRESSISRSLLHVTPQHHILANWAFKQGQWWSCTASWWIRRHSHYLKDQCHGNRWSSKTVRSL